MFIKLFGYPPFSWCVLNSLILSSTIPFEEFALMGLSLHLPVLFTLPLISFHFHQKMIFELGFSLGVISLLHPWVTCLPGCNRNTGTFVCLFCDYFAIKFSVSLKNDY